MNKGVLVGAGAGLLVLAFLGGYWLATTDDMSHAPSVVPAPAPASSAGTSAAEPALPASSPPAPAPESNASATDETDVAPVTVQGRNEELSDEERKKIRSTIRAKLRELMARKSDMSIEDLRKLVKDLEAISQGELEPEFLKRMGQMFERTEQVNQLSKQLQSLADSQAPEDKKRQREILREIDALSEQIRLDTVAMQAISRQRLASRRAEIAERRAKREAAQAEAAKAAQEATQ
ncbi:hypothetical protein [Hydrogenophaga sp. 5NK40-0174]|uniref:hypothetical protein n=1 Tax=Hydrogenophaga sp. 5NK40-0174 TaxID=3127649 RepID=UPI0031092852